MFQYPLQALYLSDSSIKRLHSCPRKLELNKFYEHARVDRDESISSGGGTSIHAAWQELLVSGNMERALFVLQEKFPWQYQNSPNDVRSIYALYTTFLAMLDHKCTENYELVWVNVGGTTIPAVEVPFRIKFKNVSLFPDRDVPIYYIGYIDALLRDKETKLVETFDVKSTRIATSDYTPLYAKADQCLPYGYVLERVLGRSADNFNVNYLVAYVDIMQPQIYHYAFTKTRADIQEWCMKMALDITHIQTYAQSMFFPKRGESCYSYNRKCIYFDVCDYAKPEGVAQYLDLLFGSNQQEPPKDSDFWFTLEVEIAGL